MGFLSLRKWMASRGRPAHREIFDALAIGVWIVDAQDRTEYVNPHMAGLLGRTPADLQGVSLLSLVPDEARDEAGTCLKGWRQNTGGQADLRLLGKDGAALRTVASGHLLAAAPGHAPGLACFIVNVTTRRQIEDATQKSETYYRVLTETAQDHIFVIDRDDRIEYVNRAAAEQLRTQPDQLIGRRRTEIFPGDVADRQRQSLQRVMTTGKPFYAEGRTMYGSREVWLGTWLAPVPDASGNITAVLGFSRDMTTRKQAEDALRATEQRLRVVLANVPLALWACDRDGVLTFCAGQALQTIGVTPDDTAGKTFDAVGIEPFPALAEHCRRALAGESFGGQVDVNELTFEAWSAPLRDEQNQVIGATGLIVDITERRRLETELSNAQKMEAIGRLAGGIAHDFNNNLTAVIGYVDMILMQIGDDKPISADLKEVQRAAERAAGLVRRLLAFGRRQVVQTRDLDLNAIIAGLTPMLERLIGESTRVVVTLAPDLPAVTGDPGQIEQVIMNLALNARDAMPGGGTLTIETARMTAAERRSTLAPDPHVVMTVRDTGMGMDARTKEHLFEPFFTTKPVGEGTGLGLATVYGIVKQLNGSIWVESEVGKGSTFRVFLPAAGVAPEIIPARTKTGSTVVRRATILLVEDEDTVRRFTKLALERHGFRVLEAALPEHALALAAASEDPIPLLVTDVVMPQMSGPELADRLKKVRPDLQVLYMSGYPASMIQGGSTLDAALRLMAKPFTTADLLSNVEDILGK
jgi:two-component system cell cycle sensor histidine kinase/response regulator CckA